MWTCPQCGAEFVQSNQSHSCGTYTVENFLKGKSERGIALFGHFLAEFERVGPIKLHVVKTRIAVMVEVRFAAINRIGNKFIDGHLWLKERVDSPRFYKIEHLGRNDYIHHFRIGHRSDIDDEFRSYMKMAYEIGERKHIRK